MVCLQSLWFLPHCTWDKFGEILADGGGRSLGLFDELMSFFTTMNMYSSNKMQVSDTREYQDFLQLFTGKSKTRETGNNHILKFQTIIIKNLEHSFKFCCLFIASHFVADIMYFKLICIMR